MKKGQSFVEYTLLVAVALIGLLATINSFLGGTLKSTFTSHFGTVKSRITGGTASSTSSAKESGGHIVFDEDRYDF